MKVRRTKLDEVEELVRLSNQAKIYLKENQVDQWQDGYPNREIFLLDIRVDESYVVEDHGRIIASFMLSFREDPTYDFLEGGEWSDEGHYGVIHRLMIDDDFKGKQVSDFVLKEVEHIGKQRKAKSIRIDTHGDNEVMLRMLVRNGYHQVGIIYLEDHSKRVALDKVIV